MRALHRIVRGMLVAAATAGFVLAPPVPLQASPEASVTAACPWEPGWYYLYDENDELIGVMLVGDNCEGRVWLV